MKQKYWRAVGYEIYSELSLLTKKFVVTVSQKGVQSITLNSSKGQYCLLGILSPAGGEVLEVLKQGLWVSEKKCLEVVP